MRDIISFRHWSVAIQAMLKETLNIETNLRTVQISQWFEEAAAGQLRHHDQRGRLHPHGSLRLLHRLVRQGRPAELLATGPTSTSTTLARQIEREVDEGKRKTMVRQAEAILENDPPLIPIAYEKIYDAWYNKVRGQNPNTYFGIYDVVRWDTVSLAG